MEIKTFKTHPILPYDSLISLIDTYIPTLQEGSILVVTSKIVSLCEGSLIKKEEVDSKEDLVRSTADAYLDEEHPFAIQLTIKNNILIPSAGIDESNGNGFYILYPRDVQESASLIWEHVRHRDKLQKLGVLITDSHTTPLRRGVIGIGLGWCGFKPLYNYIGKPDCFGSPLRVTLKNNVDSLAAASVFCMGEGDEQTPFALITHVDRIEFQPMPPTDVEVQELSIPMEEDLYGPLLKKGHWLKRSI